MNEATSRKVVTREEWCAARDALKAETMRHYDRLAACRSREGLRAEAFRGDATPLCNHYRRCEDGCPVHAATGRIGCGGTPWTDMAEAIDDLGRDVTLAEPLPEVLAMREYLAGLDWTGQP